MEYIYIYTLDMLYIAYTVHIIPYFSMRPYYDQDDPSFFLEEIIATRRLTDHVAPFLILFLGNWEQPHDDDDEEEGEEEGDGDCDGDGTCWYLI
jgi:hypothetical protein